MFLDRDTTGGDGLGNSSPSTMMPMTIEQISPTISHTGHSERRAEIRKLGANALLEAHNMLVKEIMANGAIISTEQKNIILAMEQEGVNAGGEFFGQIQENEGAYKVYHREGMSRFNELQGTTDVLIGETRLRMWSMI